MSSNYAQKPIGKAQSLAANERTSVPNVKPDVNPRTNRKAAGPVAPRRKAAPQTAADVANAQDRSRPSRTTAQPNSAQAHLIAATHGSYAFDHPAMLRPEDIAETRRIDPLLSYATKPKNIDHAIGALLVKPSTVAKTVLHPERAIDHLNHFRETATPQQKADAAIGLHVTGSIVGSPVAGPVERSAARKGEAVLFSGSSRRGLRAKPYINEHYADQGIGSVPDLAAERGYLYHRTDVRGFERIRSEGLKAQQPQGDKPAGVYFANHPLEARGLSWKSNKGSVYVRVKKDAVPTVDFKGDPRLSGQEVLSPSSVPPSALEYLGEDKAWHPLVTPTAPKKLPRPQQLAMQVVREGTPIADRIAAASTPKEAGALKAASKYVHDVHGMPRIKPEHPDLIDAYEKAAAATPQETLRGTLKGARAVRGKQEAGYSAERTQRVGNASRYLNDSSLTPAERLTLAKGELKGELPKIDFQGMKVLDENALKALQTHILDHPHLLPFQKIRAADALTNAAIGKVPTNSELTLLEHVFGKDTAAGLGSVANHPLKDMILSTLNVPRSVMASFDLSAPFRQGLVVATRHPGIFARNFKPMVKAFGSEKVYRAVLDDIHQRPTFPMMLEAKLAITDLGKSVGGREEQYASDVAEKIPVAGRAIRASGRAYTGFLDKTRADVFDHLIQRAQSQGINVQDEKFLKDLGRYINAATGRGNLPGHLQGASQALNTVFFSPRLLASRLDLIFSPVTYARTDPFVRKEALRSMFQLAGTASTLIALASQIPGAKVATDPRNPDWGKIHLHNTRIDIGGGFQQPLRLFAQLATGEAISSTTGKRLNLTANGFGQPTRLDLFLRFFEGKESPWASVATDWLRNSNQIGQKFSWGTEATQHLTPLLAQDTYDLYKDKHGGMNGLAAAFAGYAVGGLGFGLQTYGPVPPKAKPSSSTSDPYAGNPSAGGSNYAQSADGSSAGSGYAQAP